MSVAAALTFDGGVCSVQHLLLDDVPRRLEDFCVMCAQNAIDYPKFADWGQFLAVEKDECLQNELLHDEPEKEHQEEQYEGNYPQRHIPKFFLHVCFN